MTLDSAASRPVSAVRTSRLFGTAGLALMLVVGLILGYVAGLLTPAANAGPGNNSPEAGFARDMAVHHAQAVQLGELAQVKGQHPGVRLMGGDIALTQQAQIGMMNQWLRTWGLNLNESPGSKPMAWMPDGSQYLEDGLMPGMATASELAQLDAASGADFDRLFIKLMVDHHLGGIHMVDGVLELSDDSDVVWLAQSMKDGQQQEIAAMQDLLRSIS